MPQNFSYRLRSGVDQPALHRRFYRLFGGDSPGCYRRRCKVCRRGLFAMRPSARYCSEASSRHAERRRRKRRQEAARRKRCQRCGRRFKAARSDAKFCSGACRQACFRKISPSGIRNAACVKRALSTRQS